MLLDRAAIIFYAQQSRGVTGMGQAIGVIFPVLTVIIGGACILLFSVTTTLRAQNGDQAERIKFLEEERLRLVTEAAATHAELEALRKVVTGEVHLVAITDLLEHHHTQAVEYWDKWTPALTRIVAALEEKS